MVAAYEMLVCTPAIANLIRENKTYRIDSSIQTGAKDGMFLMDDSLFKLWRNNICEKEEILGRSQKPAELANRIAMAEQGITDDEEDEEDEDFDDDEDDDRPRRRRRRDEDDDD